MKTEISLLEQFGDARSRVENALAALRSGKGVLVSDDADRENEGDLIFAAETLTTEQVAMQIRDCSGIICICVTAEKARALELPMMVPDNNENDRQYFNIIMPGIFDFADHPEIQRLTVLEAMNKINAQYKVVKCVCDEEDVWLTTEIFIDSTPDIEDFFERLLNILHQSRMEFFQYLRG